MSVVEGCVTIEGIKAKLHSCHRKNIGKAWAVEWIYPKNALFDISISSSRLTIYSPDKVMIALGEDRIEHLDQEAIDLIGDNMYIVKASIACYRYGTMKATDIIVQSIESFTD